eukprot:gene34308-59036_t
MRAELVDRQANAARVADRQRALFERGVAQSGQLQASERAKASAGYIEAALTTLCPFSVAQPGGCNELGKRISKCRGRVKGVPRVGRVARIVRRLVEVRRDAI